MHKDGSSVLDPSGAYHMGQKTDGRGGQQVRPRHALGTTSANVEVM